MKTNELDYCAFMLRLWRESGQWRATLTEVYSGKQKAFATMTQLVAEISTLDTHAPPDSDQSVSLTQQRKNLGD